MLEHLEQLEELVAAHPDLHVRYSEGFEKDAGSGSMDTASGLELPGLSVNPLTPEAWWTRPVRDWLARQLCQYKHLQDSNPDRHAWVLRGTLVGRGPDCEPLLADVQQLDVLSESLLAEAEEVYQQRFARGQGPED